MKVNLGVLKDYVAFSILFEGRVDDAREKYPDMEEEHFDEIVANQPAESNNKYLMWSCKQVDDLMQDDPDPQAIQIIIQAVRLFDDNAQRLKQRDINQYEDAAAIEAAVAELGEKKSKSQEQKQAKADTDVIYQDDKFLVVRPHTTEASCKYGAGTKWCIAATGSHNYYYKSYSTNNNKFYFVIDKTLPATDPASKFALAIIAGSNGTDEGKIQVYNAPDKLVPLGDVAKHVGTKWPDIWSKIQAHVKANPSTREVEDARKATEEHVKSLLKGEKVSDEGLKKIASDGKLTAPVVNAILKNLEGYSGPTDHRDPRSDIISSLATDIISSLATRAAEIPGDAAMRLIKLIISTKPAGEAYWNGRYYLERVIERAPLSPHNFRELANTGEDTTLALIFTNPNTPSDMKEKIASQVQKFTSNDAQQKVYWEMIKSGNITREQFASAMEKQKYLGSRILSSTSEVSIPSDFIPLIPLTNAHDFKSLLKMPNVPPDYAGVALLKVWNEFPKADLYQVLRTVPITTDLVEKLWKEKGQDARTALLQNPAVGPGNAHTFARSKNSAYRFAVAHNTITPPEDLATLSTDESVSTRAAVASNTQASAEVLTRLAGDEAIAVRASVASNPKTPRDILNALKKDSDDFVRKSVRKTLKSLEGAVRAEAFRHSMLGLIREALEDDDTADLMYPSWRNLPARIKVPEFVSVFLLQNNGHATREEIETAFQSWSGKPTVSHGGGYRRPRGGRRRGYGGGYHTPRTTSTPAWHSKRWEEYHDSPRGTSAQGKGWWWSPPGINKGALFRLTPAGAAAAMELLARLRRTLEPATDATRQAASPVKKSPPPRAITHPGEETPRAPREPGVPRSVKATYKIYGRKAGAPAHTRLKGQAYKAPANTQFTPGELAAIAKGDDGNLKVRKADSDHEQSWEPTEG